MKVDFVFRFGINFDFRFRAETFEIKIRIAKDRAQSEGSGQVLPLAVFIAVINKLPREVADSIRLADVVGGVTMIAMTK